MAHLRGERGRRRSGTGGNRVSAPLKATLVLLTTVAAAHRGRQRGKSARLFSTRRFVASAVLALVAGVSLLSAAPASAFYTRHLVDTFPLPESASPFGVAINQSTGEVYASSERSGVVDAFEASGAPDPIHPKLTEANGTTPYPFITP